MIKPKICAVITGNDPAAVKEIEPQVDLFEVRIDLIGEGWPELVKPLKIPWIACNRRADEGGRWPGTESRRVEKLFQAIELGASIVDIELRTNKLADTVQSIRRRARCLVSYHDMEKTPPLDDMKEIVRQQLKAGAHIGKIVTTARSVNDNLTVMQLIHEFPSVKLVSLAMGPMGVISRILCPLVGGEFTYASMEKGKESAEGQITVAELRKIYEMVIPGKTG